MAFTPEEISQIISEFFNVVGTRQYIGARYVPIFGRKNETSIQWDNTAPYEPLTIVLYQGNSYTSRQYVPAGVDILNQDFWANTGNYNSQVEQYRQEVLSFDSRITANSGSITQLDGELDTLESEVNSNEKFQSDFSNSLVNIEKCAYVAAGNQGFCIGTDGYVYIAQSGSPAVLYKYSGNYAQEEELALVGTLSLTGNSHANSICEYNNKLYISDIDAASNTIKVVNMSNFTLETDLVVPYHGITDVSIVTNPFDSSHVFVVGRATSMNNLQVYDFPSDFDRTGASVCDFQITMPVCSAFPQGGTIRNNVYYSVFGYTPSGLTPNTYMLILPILQSKNCMPIVVPFGHDIVTQEVEDCCFAPDGSFYIFTGARNIYKITNISQFIPYYRGTANWFRPDVNYVQCNAVNDTANTGSYIVTLPNHIVNMISRSGYGAAANNPIAPRFFATMQYRLNGRTRQQTPLFALPFATTVQMENAQQITNGRIVTTFTMSGITAGQFAVHFDSVRQYLFTNGSAALSELGAESVIEVKFGLFLK